MGRWLIAIRHVNAIAFLIISFSRTHHAKHQLMNIVVGRVRGDDKETR